MFEMLTTLCEQSSTPEDVLRAWLESPAAHVRYISPITPTILLDRYTVVSTSSGSNVSAAAWTGDVPLLPDGAYTRYLSSELQKTAMAPWSSTRR
jgi:hypothetical protein